MHAWRGETLSAERGIAEAFKRFLIADFKRFSLPGTGSLCSSCRRHRTAPSAVRTSRWVTRSLQSQCGEKFGLFCGTCAQRKNGAEVGGICHTSGVSKRGVGVLNIHEFSVYADKKEDWFWASCCHGTAKQPLPASFQCFPSQLSDGLDFLTSCSIWSRNSDELIL